MRFTQRCTEEEARRILQTNDWCVSLDELDAFLVIVFAHGTHKVTIIKVRELWNSLWGIQLWCATDPLK